MGLAKEQIVFDAAQIAAMVGSLAQAIIANHAKGEKLALVGIRTGGAHLALRLQNALEALSGERIPTGLMDITLYRDDWTRLHSRPKVGKTEIDFSVDRRTIVLVDDVLFTGRTIRAAMDALIDFGRPRRIELAVLIDRGHRELPIQPDYVGALLSTLSGEMIDVYLREQGAEKDQVIKRSL